ncbi:unnamed protein product [Lactuca virosa]|uniref:Uncharacterized protein n=1 Tax=Lactuca virosa TaxID=75947 RepID=A0AAU9M7E9_9ASTR|nr:unnamed protein product [Lactuca virosa]
MDRWDFDRDTKYRSSKRKDRGGESDEEDRYGDKRTKWNEWRRFDQEKVGFAEEDTDRDERREFEDGDKLEQGKLNGETMTTMKNELKDEPCGGALGAPSKPYGTPHETPLAPSHPHPPSKVSSSLSTKHETEGVDSADAGKIGGISLNALSMAKATLLKHKALAEKMKKIPLLNKGTDSARDGLKPPSSSGIPAAPPQSAARLGGGLPRNSHEAVKRAQELAAKMGFRQDTEFAPLINKFPGELAPEKPAKAPVLSLDALGREVNENGNVVNIPKLNILSTLKVNINKQKKDAFQILKPELEVDLDENPHFDPRMGINKTKLLRPKTMTFQFVDSGTYGNVTEGGPPEDILKKEKITLYMEQPHPIEPPAEPAPPPPQPLKLTQKERKRLRTQRRLATEKARQEMIRLGLLEPPKPKVKMSNLMKVLGSEATQNPTRLEMEIRKAAAQCEQAHVDRNIARKLTPTERREKKKPKFFDDNNNTLETIVSIYKVNDLSHLQTRFKVDVNAQKNRLSGCAVISEGISVVVVEGGGKSVKRYQKLMLKRINWAAAVKEENMHEEVDDDDENVKNKCVLVWQGSVTKPSFQRFLVHECSTENAARKVFYDAGVGHYWDLVVNFSRMCN